MLKKIILPITTIFFLAGIWLGLKCITDYLETGSCHYTQITSDISPLLLYIAFIYFIYIVFFKKISDEDITYIKMVGSCLGIISFLTTLILSNTMVIGRPEFTDIYYLLALSFAFVIGYILPFSEKLIEKISGQEKKIIIDPQ